MGKPLEVTQKLELVMNSPLSVYPTPRDLDSNSLCHPCLSFTANKSISKKGQSCTSSGKTTLLGPSLKGLHFADHWCKIWLVKSTLSQAVKDEATSLSLMFYLSVLVALCMVCFLCLGLKAG